MHLDLVTLLWIRSLELAAGAPPDTLMAELRAWPAWRPPAQA